MNSILGASQNKQRAFYRLATAVLLIALIGLTIAGRMLGAPLHLPLGLVLFGLIVLAIWGVGTLDEMAKQAHYVSWYWGGSVGLLLIGAFFFASNLSLIPSGAVEAVMTQLFGKADAETAFVAGLAACPLVLTIGYGVWWIGYWLRHR